MGERLKWIHVVGVLSFLACMGWIYLLLQTFSPGQVPGLLVRGIRTSFTMIPSDWGVLCAQVGSLGTIFTVVYACYLTAAFIKRRNRPAAPPTEKVIGVDLPRWLSVRRQGDSILISGKHGTAWRAWHLNILSRLYLMTWGWNLIVHICATPKALGESANFSRRFFDAMSNHGEVAAAFAAWTLFAYWAVVPVLALPFCRRWIAYQANTRFFWRRRLTILFRADGVQVINGRWVSRAMYPFSKGDIAIRYTEPREATYRDPSDGKLNFYEESANIELIAGHRKVVVANILNQHRASDFVDACSWALAQVQAPVRPPPIMTPRTRQEAAEVRPSESQRIQRLG